jgi:hypothetical protein
MSPFAFIPEPGPFPRWMGPFSPSRGKYSGFRFHQGRLGTWVGDDSGKSFWPVADSQGARDIAALVKGKWGGGRVLFLPNGFVVKPLQENDEVGQRALIGRFHGAILLERPGQTTFDLSKPGDLRPGDRWPGPMTTGLECVIQTNGSLICTWYHPTRFGRDEVSDILLGPDRLLAAGFRDARPGVAGGRVRITANGNVITNRQENSEVWVAIFVGWVDPKSLTDWKSWIEKEWT